MRSSLTKSDSLAKTNLHHGTEMGILKGSTKVSGTPLEARALESPSQATPSPPLLNGGNSQPNISTLGKFCFATFLKLLYLRRHNKRIYFHHRDKCTYHYRSN